MGNMKKLASSSGQWRSNKMRIAITGGTGLLGRYFTKHICDHGVHTPIVISRKNHDAFMNLETRATDYSIEDLTKSFENIDAVVHLAAQRGSSENIQNFDMNMFITQNIYDACTKIGISNITYASSIAIYTDVTNLPWNEKNLPEPQTVYGISKLCSEHIGNLYTRNNRLKVKNLRFPPIYGAISEDANMNMRMINRFMLQAFHKETLVLYSKQPAKREFLYAKDAAKALLCAIEAKDLSGTFNTGSGEVLTNLEIAELINEAFDNNGNLQLENRNEKVLESSYMNSSKAATILGFRANYSFFEAMSEIYGEMSNV
jgi:UDP-glucose 4-epimerase